MSARTRLGGYAAWAGLLAACGADLQRTSGEFEIRVVGVPSGVERLEIDVSGEGLDAYRVEVAASGGEVIHVIDSVPAQRVDLRVTAFRGQVEVGREQRTVVIAADQRNQVVVDLSGLAGTLVSDPIAVSVTGARADVSAGFLEISGPLGAAWSAFIDRARGELGVDPDSFEVRTVDVQLVTGSAEIEELDEVWDDRLTVALASTQSDARVVVASGIFSDEQTRVRVPLAAGASALASLTADLISGAAAVVLSGPSVPSGEEDFTVLLDVTLVVVARDD